jgi:transmembrane sensor
LNSFENIPEKLNRLLESADWSDADRSWLLQYLEETGHPELRQLMEEQFKSDVQSGLQHPDAERLLSVINKKIDAGDSPKRIVALNWRRLLMAASVLLAIGAGTFLYFHKSGVKPGVDAVAKKLQAPHDIAPGRDNAILTLADGSTIILDNAANGTLAEQGKVKVLKLNGQIAYAGKTDKPVYNTITTSKGNQYQLVLADGSSVWLNAASSIRFPVAFTAKERRVEITGEAYFEVAPDAAKPFKVVYTIATGDKGEVQVLGTHFNINAYDDEAEVKTTLVEGKVKLTQASDAVLLKPSEEAVFSKTSRQLKVQPADVEEAIAWKTGMFEFHDADLKNILRQLSRWYDVEVKFSGPVSGKLYNGSIRRQATLSQVLQILKLAGVNYSLKERTLTIGTN